MNYIVRIGKPGLDLIKKFEEFRSEPYLCPAGVPNIGYGSTYY
jgi:lysozyme